MSFSKLFESFLKATQEVIEKTADNTPCYSDMFPGEENLLSFNLKCVDGTTASFSVKDYYCLTDGCECNSVCLKIFDGDDDCVGQCIIGWHKTNPDNMKSFRLDADNLNAFFPKILGAFFMYDIIGKENKLLEAQKRYAHVRQCVDSAKENSEQVTYH